VILHRERPSGLPCDDLDQRALAAPDLVSQMESASQRTKAEAQALSLLGAILEAKPGPIRQQAMMLADWAPIIEHLAYKYCAQTAVILDAWRPLVVHELASNTSAAKARRWAYWRSAHMMGDLTLLASSLDARPWLSEMARSFSWAHWTPSFPLVRERTLWLAACAGRSAAAFGDDVAGNYPDALSRAHQPLKVFDALYGLAAIGLSKPTSGREIVTEIAARRAGVLRAAGRHARLLHSMIENAVQLIERPFDLRTVAADTTIALLGWRIDGRNGLRTPAALRLDPALILPTGICLGFTALPVIITTANTDFYPSGISRSGGTQLTAKDVKTILRHAWTPDAASGTMH
jgi:hypothetical protein